MTVLVTCASGFVGQAFVRALAVEGERVHVLIRDPAKAALFPEQEIFVGDVYDPACIARALRGVKTVVHAPPLVYPGGDTEPAPAMHRHAQVESTRRVLNEAVAKGIGKFLFISSAHVTGRSADRALCEADAYGRPDTPYAQAKLEAEELVRSYADRHALQAVILRPPGIYGPGDKSIVTALRRAAEWNLWLPIKGVAARHSLVFVDNLARAGVALLRASDGGPSVRVFIVKDPVDYRAGDLYAAVCRALGKGNKLFWAPLPFLRVLGSIGVGLKHVPKLRWLGVFRYLLTPQRYCGHLFQETLPDFPFIGLNDALRASLGPAARSGST
jgi:nucleoside-diphosphate-sugar epimerase